MKARWVIAPCLLIAAAAVTAAILRSGSPSGHIPTISVDSTAFVQRVIAEGNLKAVESTALTAPIKSRQPQKIAWMADDGSPVKKGDVVIRFDPTDFEKDLEDGSSDRRIAEYRLDKISIERNAKQKNLTRDADLARKELDNAKAFRTTDSLVASRMEIVESQIDTELAEHRTDHANHSKTTQNRLSQADIDLLEIERQRADIKIEQAEEGLQDLQVTAPHDGIVILDRDWRGNPPAVGETVWPGRTLASLPLLDQMEAEVFVLEADAAALAVGQKAWLWIEAHPANRYAAEIKTVDPIAQRRTRRVPVQYFRVVLSLEHTDTKLMKPGQQVRAEILLADLTQAIAIPRQAVCELDGARVVFRLKGSNFDPVEVELGPSGLGRVVVTSGLSAGDVIALRDPRNHSDNGNETKRNDPDPPGGAR